MPSNDGHTPESEEGMRSGLGPGPDPNFKFGVTTPYTTAGTGAGFFDTNETLPSAVDPYGKSRAVFQPRRKDSTISGGESDGGSSSTDVGRFSQSNRKNQGVLRTQASESALNDRKMTRSPIDPGKVAPSVAEARMRRLLNELDAIGLTDDMTIGRPSLDGDDWAATSSNGHDSTPVAPLSLSNRAPAGKIPPRHDDVTRVMHSANSSRDWARGISPITTRPVNNVQPQMHRNYHPDAPESASPRSEDEDFYDPRPDMSPLTGGSNGGSLPPRQNSPPVRGGPPPGRPPPQNMQGLYQPMRSAPLNSAAFPMPPRGPAPQVQQSPPPVTRTRRPGTAGNDPPVSYFNNAPNTAPVNRTRFGSDQNLRERYAASNLQAPVSSPPQSSNQSSLSPVSPMSAPAMTLSSGSRTNSTISGALETPIEEPAPITPLASAMNPSPKPPPSESSNEKSIREKVPLRETSSQEEPNYRLESPPGGLRRGSVDAGTTLASPAEAERSRSPVVEAALSRLHQNPFLGGGLTFGGVGFALKDRDAGNPPPYRMHPSPSSGPNGRANSLRAASVGGRSDASGSSFGDGVSPKTDRKATPAVALATAFVRDGVPGLSAPAQPGMSKAERAAEKARMKAEKAAQKAEEASRKVEEEREAKMQAEALKKKKKEEKVMKRLQLGEMGLHGFNGMVRFNA
ncbi:hypothetical protein CPB86DRAFT_333204 [Serendipita vermifera]|nr:hypothetical protein CPB86DRAFT_333204 [Serendipita vermifera]